MGKTFEEMTFDEKVAWATGELIIAIGEGKFKDAVYSVVLKISQDAYNRGSTEKKGK